MIFLWGYIKFLVYSNYPKSLDYLQINIELYERVIKLGVARDSMEDMKMCCPLYFYGELKYYYLLLNDGNVP